MRIKEDDTEIMLVLESTGDIAKLLTVFQYYNNQIPRKSFKPIPQNIIDRLEDEIVQN